MKRLTKMLGAGLGLTLTPLASAQSVHYVDPSATGADDGTTWSNAFNDLHDALAACSPGDQVWIKEGVYIPNEKRFVSDSRSVYFHIRGGTSVFGGFAGTESSISQRYGGETILSGEIGSPSTATDNAYSVVEYLQRGSNHGHAIIDGITVRDGYNDNTTATVYNSVAAGLTCRWEFANPATPDEITIDIINCKFLDNYSKQTSVTSGIYRGCGLMISRWSGIVKDSIFDNNEGTFFSSLYVFKPRGDCAVIGSTFLNGTTEFGIATVDYGEVSQEEELSFDFINCVFVDNKAKRLVQDDVFYNGAFGGVVFYSSTGSAGTDPADGRAKFSVVNSFFGKNQADVYTAGIGVAALSRPCEIDITNCTFRFNLLQEDYQPLAPFSGHNISIGSGTNCVTSINNCLSWDVPGPFDPTNPGGVHFYGHPEIGYAPLSGSPTPTANYCMTEYQDLSALGSNNQSGTDPDFIPTSSQIYSASFVGHELSSSSAAIDSGNRSALPPDTFDVDSDLDFIEYLPTVFAMLDRFVNSVNPDSGSGIPAVDIGSYESQEWCVGDWDRNGTVDTNDFSAYMTSYNSQDPEADLNNDSLFNVFDIQAFTTVYNTGC